MMTFVRRLSDRLAHYVGSSDEDIAVVQQQYDKLFGGSFDPYVLPPSQTNGYLREPTEDYDREVYAAAGITNDAIGWQLPEAQWSDHELLTALRPWWIHTPPDLISHADINPQTVTGESVYAYVHVEDWAKGPDSTAVPLVYAAIPVASALALVMSMILVHFFNAHTPTLARVLIGLMCLTPVAVIGASLTALKEMFGFKAALKAALLGIVFPLYMGVGGGLSNLMALRFAQIPGGGTLGWVGMSLVGLVAFVAFGWTMGGFGHTRGNLGGFWARLGRMFWWCIAGGAVVTLVHLLPTIVQPAVAFLPACVLAVMHQDEVWRFRAEDLSVQGKMSNRIRNISFFRSDYGPKVAHTMQVVRAVMDRTLFIPLATSSGKVYQATKSLLAPAIKGMVMGLTEKDLETHFIGFGGTGTGKTYSFGLPIIAFLSRRKKRTTGGLVLDGKGGQLVEDTRDRLDVVLEPGADWAPLQGTDGVQLGFALATFRPNGTAAKVDEGGDGAIWKDGAELYNSHVVAIHDALHHHELVVRGAQRRHVARRLIQTLILDIEALQQDCNTAQNALRRSNAQDDIQDLRTRLAQPRKWRWNYAANWKSVQEANEIIVESTGGVIGKKVRQWKQYLGFEVDDPLRVLMHPETIHPEVDIPSSSLSESFAFLDQWAAKPEVTRGSFFSNVSMIWSPLMKTGTQMCNAQGIPWIALEQGSVGADMALRGKWVGVALNVANFGPAALIMLHLVRARAYSILRRRGGTDWKKDKGATRCAFVYDEAQMLVGKDEMELMPISRSLGGSFCLFSQGLAQFRGNAKFGEQEMLALLDECKSIACLKTDRATYQYIANRLGKIPTYVEMTPQNYVNAPAAVNRVFDSNIANPDHPMSAYYQEMERGGFGGISVHAHHMGKEQMGALINEGHHLAHSQSFQAINMLKSIDPVMSITTTDQNGNQLMAAFASEDDLTTNLMEAGTGQGFLAVQRAGVMRIDFCQFTGLGTTTADDDGDLP